MRLRGSNLLSEWNTLDTYRPSFQGSVYKHELFFSPLTFLAVSNPISQSGKAPSHTEPFNKTPGIAVDSGPDPQVIPPTKQRPNEGYIWKDINKRGYMWILLF